MNFNSLLKHVHRAHKASIAEAPCGHVSEQNQLVFVDDSQTTLIFLCVGEIVNKVGKNTLKIRFCGQNQSKITVDKSKPQKAI